MPTFPVIFIYVTSFFALFTAVYFFLSLFEFNHRMKNPPFDAKKAPIISIAIACYNEEESIVRTLQSVYEVDYPRKKFFAADLPRMVYGHKRRPAKN
jgi:cellulose synthase/poly-beta-1,6-N-acetylglucosamine synthase-like glycosyltransferase